MKMSDRLYHILTSVIAIVVSIVISATVHAESPDDEGTSMGDLGVAPAPFGFYNFEE